MKIDGDNYECNNFYCYSYRINYIGPLN